MSLNSPLSDSCDDSHYPKFGQHIAMVATETSGMMETGFGPIDTCKSLCLELQKIYGRVTFHVITTMHDLEQISAQKPDLVILCQKYFIPEKDGIALWFSEYFSQKKINFTGSIRKSLAYDSNKSIAKTVISNSGIATAKFFLTSPGQIKKDYLLPLEFPLFIKLINAANSYGIDETSIVHNFEAYVKKVDELQTYNLGKILVEEYLPGREFTVAVFDDESTGQRWSFPLEIITGKNNIGNLVLGYDVKNQNLEKLKPLSEPLAAQLNWLASRVFSVLKARDFARIDFKLDSTGALNFMEINLVPGLTQGSSYFPEACAILNSYSAKDNPDYGLKYVDVINKIAEIGLNRCPAFS